LVYRLWFQSGICDEVPVANQDLTSIKRSCPFATGDSANSLSPNQKRNIMYWWYATNIFLIYGKGNCGPLPEYLVYAIWCQYLIQKEWNMLDSSIMMIVMIEKLENEIDMICKYNNSMRVVYLSYPLRFL
jgi:hypothetical protein